MSKLKEETTIESLEKELKFLKKQVIKLQIRIDIIEQEKKLQTINDIKQEKKRRKYEPGEFNERGDELMWIEEDGKEVWEVNQ